jgi:hypothetical protein
MILGFDFDNTLISYDKVFRQVAIEKALIPASIPEQKNAVRNHLRIHDKEVEWTRLQGEVYGSRILEAEPYPGMLEAIGELTQRRIPMRIVSHKTRTPYIGDEIDLHASARSWLNLQGFFNSEVLDWKDSQVFFEITKEEKVARIIGLGCTHFVDDLPEILTMLPGNIQKILFSPNEALLKDPTWRLMTSWQDFPKILGLR